MPAEVMSATVALVCVMILAITAQWRRGRQAALARQLQHAGSLTTGKVIAINRPFGAPRETHVYFSYEVPGVGTLLQSCCVDLRALREQHAVFLPSVGSEVTVRYLPQAPDHAILPQLAPCLLGAESMPGAVPVA